MKRIAVAGLGTVGKRHAQNVMAHPGAELAAVIDPASEVLREIPAPSFATIHAIDMPVDGLILATPTPLHAEGAAIAAARGWPLLVEKPVAHTLASANALIEAVRDVPVLIGHHRRYHTCVRALRDGLEAGRIGRPVIANLLWAVKKPDDYFQQSWRTIDGSPVLINLVHDLDLLRMLFGEITRVAALPGALVRQAGRTESGAIALAFAGGVTATIAFADTAPSPWSFEAGTGENPHIGATGEDMLFIAGTDGGVSFPSLTWWHGTGWDKPATAAPDPVERTNALAIQLDHFLDVIDGAAPHVTLQDGQAALGAALEIERQMMDRKAV
ncbi:MAG: Gfo/Idh/MocA family oxidoreductase [Pseudomonadota bacterium]